MAELSAQVEPSTEKAPSSQANSQTAAVLASNGQDKQHQDVEHDLDGEKASPYEEGDTEKGKAEGHSETPNASPRDIYGIAWFLTVIAVLAANFLFALDNTIVADIQPAIINDFHSLDKISWLSVAFLLASAGTNLLWGDLYARFSTKWTFCSAFVVFAVGSAICGAAPEIDALIVGRAICGVGGAGMYIGSITLMTAMTSEVERPLYLSIVGVAWGLGTVLGPIIGGAFVESNATWRWAFYLNLVVGGICAPIYLLLLPTLNPRPGQTIKERLVQIDFLGVVLICGFFISIVMAISFGGTEYAWGSGQIIALFIVAFVLFCVFLVQQIFAVGTTEDHRIFPVQFLKSSTMCVLFVQVVTSATCIFIPIYFLPLYFQFVKGDGAIIAGVRILPFVCFQVFFTIASGFIIGKTGYYVPWYILAGVFSIPGAALLFTVTDTTPLANIYGFEILLAIGAGTTVQASFPVAQVKVTPDDIPRAVGWCTLAQLGGPTIALSIANSVFLNRASLAVGNILPQLSATDISGIISDANDPSLRGLPAGTQQQVVAAIVYAMSKVYILDIVAGGLTLILAFWFKVNDRLFQ